MGKSAVRCWRCGLLVALLLASGVAAWLVLTWLESGHRRIRYTLIESGLFMGEDVATPPPGTNAVLNLCEQSDPYQCDVHRWEPIGDAAPAPDVGWLKSQDFIAESRTVGRTVFVHCRNGVSRSGMVVVAYLMFEHRWTRDEALTFTRSKRDIARPNPIFMERLNDWEKHLQDAQ
jgi:hypothetical protein